MPVPDDELARLARLWLDLHGDQAIPLARDMVAELEKSDNVTGADMWRRVVVAIEELQRPLGGERQLGAHRSAL
jgi:hypothetical protein